ncbi:Phosphoglycerate mutase-like protein 4 [Bienertia sinuspersici]
MALVKLDMIIGCSVFFIACDVKNGSADIELNEIRRRQAVTVAKRFSREPNVSVIHSSSLEKVVIDEDLPQKSIEKIMRHPRQTAEP